MLTETTVSKDERVNAALAHAGILLDFLGRGALGTILAFIIWLTQRGKSGFVARQAAQAIAYQLIGVLVSVTVWLAWGLVFAVAVFIPTSVNFANAETIQAYTMIPAIALALIPITVSIGWVVYGVYAAIQVWKGQDFSYPVIGSRIK